MTDRYVRFSDGNNADDGTTWALAKKTITGGLAASAAGDKLYVSHAHAETGAVTITWTSPGTAAAPVEIICVNDGAEPPTALATTATVTITAASNSQMVFAVGYAYVYGVTFNVGSAANTQLFLWNQNASGWNWKYRQCTFNLGSTSTTAYFDIGDASANTEDIQVIWKDCTVSFGNASQKIQGNSPFLWDGGALAAGAAIPTTLFTGDGQDGGGQVVKLSGVDLSLATTGKNLINLARASPAFYDLSNCKLGASVTIGTGTHVGPGGVIIRMVNSDSANTNYRYWYQDYQGTIEHETTIVRTGGASNGTTSLSREMISSANARMISPLVLRDLTVWNETTGSSVTLTAHVITDNVTLTDQDAWLEVEYAGTSSFPLALVADDADSLTDRLLGGSATAQTTSTETWTTTGLGTPVKQQLSVAVTPTGKGPIRCRVVLAKASTTMWVCPKIEVS